MTGNVKGRKRVAGILGGYRAFLRRRPLSWACRRRLPSRRTKKSMTLGI